MTEETHQCTACSCDFTDDEGGVHGDFGILPMSFCPTCLSCMLDMAEQLNPKEWVGLTDEEVNDLYMEGMGIHATIEATEAKLEEKNNG